jgi:outer membrane protein OmpA-like peptidoglycan-associated protein
MQQLLKKNTNPIRRFLMKRFIVSALLVAMLGVFNDVQAQFNSELGWGLSLGGAEGSNRPGDDWGMQFRGYLQSELFFPMLKGQLGVGYVQLSAHSTANSQSYSTDVILADFRLLFSPFTLPNFDPYLYAGFGVSRSSIGGDALAMVPFGVGIQTKISNGVLLSFDIGYDLYLSDQLDGQARTNTYLNDFTNGKQDGFYGFTIGAAFTLGSGKDAAEEKQKKELAEAEARRVKAEENAWHAKELANTEARRVQDSVNAAAMIAHVREASVSEIQRIKDSTKAAVDMANLKAASIAEIQRIKDSTNAAKSRDTLIVLIKGKTVVLRGVNFESNKATLTKYSENILWKAYYAMVENPAVQVVITGYTDNVGNQKKNQVLSLKRAQAVKNWLVQKGIESNRMRTVGRGENEPVASNETSEGRLENRRIEFYVEK